MINNNFWKNKKVLITGHSGFKGSWLSIILHKAGAHLYGYSLKNKNKDSLFNSANIKKIYKENKFADIRNKKTLKQFFEKIKPDIAIHLAAQPLVGVSYSYPTDTFEVNFNGTLNFLNNLRQIKNLKTALIITSDKCYDNKEWVFSYRENDALGGKDPYSASKACSELLFHAYNSSFFKKEKINVASVRGGNVIGGGDWSDDRLFADIAKSFTYGTYLKIRNPNANRPWQHVLEPLLGYIKLIEKLAKSNFYSSSWNFGPYESECVSVSEIINICKKKNFVLKYTKKIKKTSKHEAKNLKLDITKSVTYLDWRPKLSIDKALDYTIDWYKFYKNNRKRPKDIYKFTERQINSYYNLKI